jgi:hypothetical protein
MSTIRVLVVEDFAAFRQVIRSILGKKRELQIICEVSDGLEAVSESRRTETRFDSAGHRTPYAKWNRSRSSSWNTNYRQLLEGVPALAASLCNGAAFLRLDGQRAECGACRDRKRNLYRGLCLAQYKHLSTEDAGTCTAGCG